MEEESIAVFGPGFPAGRQMMNFLKRSSEEEGRFF